MPPGRAVAAGPEVSTPPSEAQPVQLVPFQVRVHSAPSEPRMNARMSPVPWAAMAGASSTTSARADAAVASTAMPHARTPRTLRQTISDCKLAPRAQMARVLAREADDEARVVAEIAPPQSPGLLDQPEGPLEAEALEGLRGLALEAG